MGWFQWSQPMVGWTNSRKIDCVWNGSPNKQPSLDHSNLMVNLLPLPLREILHPDSERDLESSVKPQAWAAELGAKTFDRSFKNHLLPTGVVCNHSNWSQTQNNCLDLVSLQCGYLLVEFSVEEATMAGYLERSQNW